MKFISKLLIICFLVVPVVYSNENIVKSSSGIVTGYLINNVFHWDDIPYAKPPIDDLRWRAPRELDKSAQNNLIRPLDNNFCVQEPSGLGGPDTESYISGTEDCLYLDIKTPNSKSKEPLPVMFWIHGGGNTSGLKDIYDFSPFVKKHKVIVVSINYRLGPFGWFTHPSIQDLQSGDDKTSNFGTLDIIAALKWVQSNIALFGGDPQNITIFGESAGGHNVFSLLVAKQAKGLFHKAISQSGYTTTFTKDEAYKQNESTSTSKHASWSVVNEILKNKPLINIEQEDKIEIRNLLKNMSSGEFFDYYSNRASYENLVLLTADRVVIPEIGLTEALAKKEYVHSVPIIAGSNRDEVKFWLASAKYFVDLDHSFLGSVFGVPKVTIKNKDAFNLFNSYRSRAWKIRGVDTPLRNLYKSGNDNLYAYRYDWDDHRRFIIADFRELIGSAHATEIPLLTGNNNLVGDYGFLIYPRGPSKKFTSKNMMNFWANFAKNGKPGFSSNGIEWKKYEGTINKPSNYMILDNKKNLKMQSDNFNFSSLIQNLYNEDQLSEIEKCVVLFQMLTYVGNDLYDELSDTYPGKCTREKAEQFIINNSSFVEY